jgi:uncharacterized protein (DUF1499 family)
MGRVAAWLGGIALLLFLVGPFLAYFQVTGPAAGFYTFGAGVLLGVFTLVTSLIPLIRGPSDNRRRALVGLLAAVIIIGTVVFVAGPNSDVPRINDITTDTQDPPVFVHAKTLADNAARDMTYPGDEFAKQQKEGYPDLAPLRLQMLPDQAFSRVQLAARSMPGWQITSENPQGLRLEGFETSALFRFVDDFVIEVRKADGGDSEIQMRSKSRVGRGDVGANAKRIEAFFARLGSSSGGS